MSTLEDDSRVDNERIITSVSLRCIFRYFSADHISLAYH